MPFQLAAQTTQLCSNYSQRYFAWWQIQVISGNEKSGKSYPRLADEYGVGKTQTDNETQGWINFNLRR